MPHQRNPRDRSLIATDRRAWSRLRARIIVRDKGMCQSCGAANAAEVDHIVPRSKGGGDEPHNLQLLCHQCHAKRRRLSAADVWRGGLTADHSSFVRRPATDEPALYPVHNCGTPELPSIRGNMQLPRWEGEGCPPGCPQAIG
ncbi:MAG TPA: HNH endonuclease [Candidatus Limnocylindrales bacterium]|nr:HNH endonuclease [Candidatus Limnocylindrales bacterium]